MKSTVEKLSPTHAKIEIVADSNDLKPEIDNVYKELADQVAIPGFRKGKVPQSLIKQRVGAEYVLENAANKSLDAFYRTALEENKIFPLSQPEVDVVSMPDAETLEGEFKVTLELDIRPDIELPDYSNIHVEVDPAVANDEDVDKELHSLRDRFGALKAVERPAVHGDHVSVDMVAKVDGEEVDSATGISYKIGSGNMLDGMDDALVSLSEGEDATFNTKLAGGEHAGKEAEVTLKVNGVKERELPELDDDFAQTASEFDTVDELKEDIAKKVAEDKVFGQKVQAHERTLDALLEKTEIPVPDSVIDEEVKRHFEQSQEDATDEEHVAEVRKNAEKAFKSQLLLDTLAEKEDVQVGQQEMIDYIVASAQQYGMDPNEFAGMLDQTNQVPMLVGEIGRKKALSKVVEAATVKDSEGNVLDLSEPEEEAVETSEETAPETSNITITGNATDADETATDSTDDSEEFSVEKSEETEVDTDEK